MASTDLTDFRNQFLARAQTDLLAVDLAAATTNTLLIKAALLRGYDSVNKFDAIGPDAIYPLTLMTGAELDTYLSDPANAASFEAILSSTEARTALVNSSTAMTAVAASATAMTAVIASATALSAVTASATAMTAVAASATAMTAVAASATAMTAVAASATAMTAVAASATAMTAVAASATAMTAVAASATAMTAVIASATALSAVTASATAMTAVAASATAMTAVAASATAMTAVTASATAMTAVWASNTAADAVLTSSTAKLAVYNADTALTALQANPTQVARQIGIGGRCVSASTSASAFVFVPNNTKVILLRRYYGGTEFDMIDWARGSTAAAVGQGPSGGGRDLDTGAQALGTQSGVYTSNGVMPTANNDTANFVSAANGLQRRTWNNGYTLYVIYITV